MNGCVSTRVVGGVGVGSVVFVVYVLLSCINLVLFSTGCALVEHTPAGQGQSLPTSAVYLIIIDKCYTIKKSQKY